MDVIFTSEKLDKSDKLVNKINKLTIIGDGYELNKATASDAQGNLTSHPDTINHTSNRLDIVSHNSNVILDQTILSFQTIGDEGNFCGRNVRQCVESQDSAANQKDWRLRIHPNLHSS